MVLLYPGQAVMFCGCLIILMLYELIDLRELRRVHDTAGLRRSGIVASLLTEP